MDEDGSVQMLLCCVLALLIVGAVVSGGLFLYGILFCEMANA